MFRYLVAALFGLGLSSAASADVMCDWRIEGQVFAEHQMPVPMFTDETGTWRPDRSPLAGVQVRIRGNAPIVPGWIPWGWVTTDDEGRFVFEDRKTCNRRVLRIDVKLANDDLRIIRAMDNWFDGDNETFEQLSPWYTIINDRETGRVRNNTRINLDPRTFGPGRNHELGEEKAYQRADMWVAMTEMMDELSRMGSAYEFQDRVNIAYPLFEADYESVRPFANPYSSGLTFITGAYYNLTTLYHEVGHIWAYQQSRGEGCLGGELAFQGIHYSEDTHTITREACPSFHEGFAEFFGQHMINRVMGLEESLPAARFYLADFIESKTDPSTDATGEPNLSTATRIDRGWQSLLFMMTTPSLHRYDFLTQDHAESSGDRCGEVMSGFHDLSCVVPLDTRRVCMNPVEEASFQDILSLFQAHSADGYSSRLDTGDMSIDSFLMRAQRVLDSVDGQTTHAYRMLLDPSRTGSLLDVLGCPRPSVGGPFNAGGSTDTGPAIPGGRRPYDPGDGNPGPGPLGGFDLPDTDDVPDPRTDVPVEQPRSMRAEPRPDLPTSDWERPVTNAPERANGLVGDRDRPVTESPDCPSGVNGDRDRPVSQGTYCPTTPGHTGNRPEHAPRQDETR